MAAEIGTKERAFTSEAPMALARELMLGRWQTEGGKPGLWERGGEFWEWYAGRWQQRSRRDLEDAVYLALEGTWVRSGGDAIERMEPTKGKVEEVVRALEAVCRMPHRVVPCWLNGEGAGNGQAGLVTFDDVIVDVVRTAETGQWVTYERTENWFDPVTIGFKWDPQAVCPEYDRVMAQWSEGDPAWEELSDRLMGFMLMSRPRYGRIPLLCGKSRAGKGTKMRLLQRVLGPGYFSMDMRTMIGEYGLDGVGTARVIAVNEVMDLDDYKGEEFVSKVKQIVGRDKVPVNGKWKHIVREQLEATVVLTSNQIPRLPNHSRGMSSKLVILPFTVSFEGREDPGLEDRLMGELPGIVARWVKAAVRLEGAATGAKFPMTEAAEDMLKQYHLQNNPMDCFLDWGFVENPEGFVNNEMLNIMRQKFEEEFRVGFKVAKNLFASKIERESSWHVRRGRQHGGGRGLWGMSVKANLGDEQADGPSGIVEEYDASEHEE